MECSNYLGVLHAKYILIFELVTDIISSIYKAIDSFTNKKYIVKIFDNYDISFEKEVQMNTIISASNNPFFVKFVDSSFGELIRDDNIKYKHYIAFENASKGDLLKYININKSGFSEKLCKYIFYKILKAIQVLHNLGISHRNIKIDNILLDGDNYDIKIFDLSSAEFMTNEKGQKILFKKSKENSNYTAPEIIMGIPHNGEKIDIFSLGVLLFILRTGKYGFKEAKINNISFDINDKLYKLIKNKKYDKYWELIEKSLGIKGLSQEFKKLYLRLVAFNPKERPTIEDILNNDWFKEMNNLSEEQFKKYEEEMINELKKNEELLNLIK